MTLLTFGCPSYDQSFKALYSKHLYRLGLIRRIFLFQQTYCSFDFQIRVTHPGLGNPVLKRSSSSFRIGPFLCTFSRVVSCWLRFSKIFDQRRQGIITHRFGTRTTFLTGILMFFVGRRRQLGQYQRIVLWHCWRFSADWQRPTLSSFSRVGTYST